MKQAKYTGQTLAEYGILLGVLGLLAYLGLNSLGLSINGLLKSSGTQVQSNQFQNYLSLSFQASPGSVPNALPAYQGKNATMSINPTTGLPELKVVNAAAATNSNVSSVDGNVSNVYATSSVAQQLSNLSGSITDPILIGWYGQITYLAHLLAGAEGDHVGLKVLQIKTVPTGIYNDGSAYRDVYNYQNQLSDLLANPPAGANPDQIKMVSTLGADAWNNAQPFVAQLSPYIKPDGTLDTQALASSKLGKNMSDSAYDSLVSYSSLQNSVVSALTDPKAKSYQPVQATITDATTLKTVTSP